MVLEEFLREVREYWQAFSLELVPAANGKCRLIRGYLLTAERCVLSSLRTLLPQVERHVHPVRRALELASRPQTVPLLQGSTGHQSQFNSPFLLWSLLPCYSCYESTVYAFLTTLCLLLQVFEQEAQNWEARLTSMRLALDTWVDVQRRWLYLEGIFNGISRMTLMPLCRVPGVVLWKT